VARQFRNRRKASGVTRIEVISILAVFPILAVVSVPSPQNVTDAQMRREGLRKVEQRIVVNEVGKFTLVP
jgi:Tfp pilus assembly protein PilE